MRFFTPQQAKKLDDLVVIAPVDSQGNLFRDIDTDVDPLECLQSGLVRIRTIPVRHVTHFSGDLRQWGLLLATNGRRGRFSFNYHPCTTVHASALKAVMQAVPNLSPSILWALWMHEYRDKRICDHMQFTSVNYAPISPGLTITVGNAERDTRIMDYLCRLQQSSSESLYSPSTQENIKREIFMKGDFWVLTPPDEFPFDEAFKRQHLSPLPHLYNEILRLIRVDVSSKFLMKKTSLLGLVTDALLVICEYLPLCCILSLISTSRTMFVTLFPFANTMAYRKLPIYEPWYLPESTKEHPWYSLDSNNPIVASPRKVPEFPFLYYALACYQSPSMKNRKRIWGIGLQLETLAREYHIIQ
ncbi:hypothetical protein C8Q75DRAFT_146328 [Abortiporus biennis]|nr:hypothetical protein C8Q75DRAFT_146328 [Abortiporus biennis]